MPRIIDAFAQFFDDNGNPLVNGYLKFFESGTNNTTKNTYADINETIANANPVPLTAAGRCPNVFGTGTYNVISYTSDMVQIQQFDPVNVSDAAGQFSSWDSVTIYGIGDLVIGSDDAYYRSLINNNENQDPTISPGQWEQVKFVGVWNINVTYAIGDCVYGSDGVLYRSSTSPNLGNDPTVTTSDWINSSIPVWIAGTTYAIGSMVQGSDGLIYTAIASTINNNPISDGTNWRPGANVRFVKGADLTTADVTAGALALGSDGNQFDFTGTDTITSIDTVAIGSIVKIHFTTTATLTGGAGFDIPSGSYVTAAGDELEFFEYAAGSWRVTAYSLASGEAIINAPTAANGASLSLISTLTASSSSVLDFTNIDGTYNSYLILFDDLLPSVNSDDLRMRFSITNGVSFISTATYQTSLDGLDSNGTAISSFSTAADHIRIAGFSTGITNATDYAVSGDLLFNNPASAKYKRVIGRAIYAIPTTFYSARSDCSGTNLSTIAAVDGIRFYMSTGVIVSGTISLYGIKDA